MSAVTVNWYMDLRRETDWTQLPPKAIGNALQANYSLLRYEQVLLIKA